MRRIDPRFRSRGGFTLVELMIVALVLSVLAGIAMPNLRRAITRARATAVVGDLQVVRVGLYTYFADHNSWPPDRNRGRIPSDLLPYLPAGFSFVSDEYTLDYDNWAGRRGRSWRNTFDIGVTVIMRDKELGDEVVRMLGTNTWTNGRNKFTWVLEGQGN